MITLPAGRTVLNPAASGPDDVDVTVLNAEHLVDIDSAVHAFTLHKQLRLGVSEYTETDAAVVKVIRTDR